MTEISKGVAIFAFGVVLGAGAGASLGLVVAETNQGGEGVKPEAPVVQKGYTEIGSNTFLIHGAEGENSVLQFGENLASFREQNSGEFILMPENPRSPFSNDVLAFPKSVLSSDGKPNTISVGVPGSLEE
jgi:hypothetical protein